MNDVMVDYINNMNEAQVTETIIETLKKQMDKLITTYYLIKDDNG